MIYSSLLFIYGFLPFSIIIYFLTPKKAQMPVLLGMSMVFCGMLGLRYLAVMTAYTAVNYVFARLVGVLSKSSKILCGGVFALGMFFDIAALFMFRTDMFQPVREALRLPEAFYPIGFSFTALSAAGILIDVYTGKTEADRDIVRFGLYFMFFPRIIMGPLIRYRSFVKIAESRRPDLAELGVGFTIFIKGLAKKVIAADTLYAMYTAVMSQDVTKTAVLTAWLGAVSYVLCLYFMLSGFSDMGVGAGHCFGIKMPQSFNYPLFSTKIRYFASRWHIQLIHWVRRYVTKPVSSRVKNRFVKKLILICAWSIIGYWYTFTLNGMIWGMIIGTSLVVESWLRNAKLLDITGAIYTFFVIIMSSVFLFGNGTGHSLRYLLAMLGRSGVPADSLSLYLLKSYVVVMLVCMYASTDLFRNMLLRSGKERVRRAVTIASPVIVLALLIVCTALISYSGTSGMILMEL
jgi:alginate O-acetyltransferase complex protein AlgI